VLVTILGDLNMRYVIFLVGLGIFVASEAIAQQIPDLSFLPEIENPAYPSGKGPVVMVDEAHFNFDTAEGRYKPFAELLRRDGYIVKSLRSKFNKEALSTGQILVISNALSERNQRNWSLPTPSAFSDEEIAIVRDWVGNGGSLLLIAGHMPFPGTAADLASAFGIRFNNGFAFETQQQEITKYYSAKPMIFRRSDGSLANHPITNGRMDNERVDSVATFTGQAFQSDVDVQPLLMLRSSAISLMPTAAWEFTPNTPRIPIEGWFQGVVMDFGKGRAAFFGEPDMFRSGGSKREPIGMNAPVAAQNSQFLLNVLHWLSGLLGDRSGPEKKPAKSLHHAALFGHIDQVQLLISSGSDVNAKDKLDQTPLHWAAITGRRKVAELLLSKGADVNAKHWAGDTALHVAASRPHKGMAQLLIAKGADVNAKNAAGGIPLHYVAESESVSTEVIELLIAKGADVNSKNNDDQTPVDAAMTRNRRNIIELLVARGADISNIHLAAYLGDADKVKSFLDEGADVNEESESGYTPLHYAAMENSKDVAELLIAKGAGVNPKNKYSATPLHEAVSRGYKDLAGLLIASGADVNARASTGVTTPLGYAAYLGHKDIAELLITKGADVNAKDNTGSTPLWWAKKRGHKEIAKLLRKHGAKK
jgi:ankyrin repeat protein